MAKKKKISKHVALKPASLAAGPPSIGSPALSQIQAAWMAAITAADKNTSLGPLIAYLRRPAVQLSIGECLWLRLLFERVQLKRKKRGRFTPLGAKSAAQRHAIGAAHVRELKRAAKARGDKLSNAAAIDIVTAMYPSWFGRDQGKGLADFIRRARK